MTPVRAIAGQLFVAVMVIVWSCESAAAQTVSPPVTGQVTVHVNSASRAVEGLATRSESELTTSAVLETAPGDRNGLEFGLDLRHGRWLAGGRPDRLSLYNGFAGVRIGGAVGVRARAGHMWLPDLGTMGALAGGLVEVDRRAAAGGTRVRVGAFTGLEPNYFDLGYVADVRKHGGYAAFERGYLQRHVVGLTVIKQSAMTERAVVSFTNFVPAGPAVFVYQAAEVEARGPAQGAATPGLSYLLTNVRVTASPRVELHGTYNRGRSLDARRLTADLLHSRALAARDLEGLRYEGGGARATVEVLRGVYVYGGYARDRTNRDDASTGRLTMGGHAGNVANSGLDVSFSNSLVAHPTGPYHSLYLSVGRSVGRGVYMSADYSTSLSVLRFERLDGVVIETRPWTRRWSGSISSVLARHASVLGTIDYTEDGTMREVRVLAGLSYRLR